MCVLLYSPAVVQGAPLESVATGSPVGEKRTPSQAFALRGFDL